MISFEELQKWANDLNIMLDCDDDKAAQQQALQILEDKLNELGAFFKERGFQALIPKSSAEEIVKEQATADNYWLGSVGDALFLAENLANQTRSAVHLARDMIVQRLIIHHKDELLAAIAKAKVDRKETFSPKV